jgi:hypothetical protein
MSEPSRILSDGREIPDCDRYEYFDDEFGWSWNDNDHAPTSVDVAESCAFAAAWWRMQYEEASLRGLEDSLDFCQNQIELWQRKFQEVYGEGKGE